MKLPDWRGPFDPQSGVLTREKFERFWALLIAPEPEEKRIARERYIEAVHASIARRIEREDSEKP